MKKILLTGATGFIGNAILQRLVKDAIHVPIVVARRSPVVNFANDLHLVKTLNGHTDWGSVISKADFVIHAAARVHIMNEVAQKPLEEFREVNVAGTLNLARQAAAGGVKRFIFVSSIKVNGELTLPGKAYFANDATDPTDPYGISKKEAEQGLKEIAFETGMEIVIVRPVLVYGPGVKANFRSMMNWLSNGIPLPLGLISNKRSFVALDNLVDLIVRCVDHPAAANQTFLVSDGEDMSTTELLQRMGRALDMPVRLVPVPAFLLQAGAALIGKGEAAKRLCGSLQVDITKTRELLDWTPPVSVDAALQKTAKEFLASSKR